MIFDVMTLFPELIDRITSESIIGRARQAGILTVRTHNIRDYSTDKHRRVDDTPYGGGMGMLMAAPPVYDCFMAVRRNQTGSSRCIYMSPKGQVLTQKKASELLAYDNLTILCGHYEGIDRRVIDEIVDEEISVGDYILTGGELPACILIDAVSRLIDGVLADPECYEKESIASGELEFPQYTRPYDYHGMKVPEVLLSGNHAEILAWRRREALRMTQKCRPDLL
ncbi:MAG: tRNA (guanosine(37)-N1)-methyltransferase TrmD [Eubacteriales bacterium]